MFSHLDTPSRRLYAALFVNFMVIGISMTVFGATVPQIINGFGWTYVTTGVVLAMGSVGSFIATFASGMLLRHLRPRTLLLIGLGGATLGLVFFGRTPDPLVNGLLNALIGMGGGFSEVITNSVVIRMERRGESRLMNLMHAAFCIGAVAGPLAAGILAVAGIGFNMAFLGAGVIQAIVLAVLMFQTFPRMDLASLSAASEKPAITEPAVAVEPAMAKLGQESGLKLLLRRPLLIAFAAALFLYVGVELAMSNWIAEYFVRFRGAGIAAGALMVSVYWTGLLVGRLGLSFFYKGTKQEMLLALLALSSVVWFASTILMPLPWLSIVAAFLTGLSFSGIYPIVMSMVGTVFNGSTAAVGLCATAGGIGLFVFPLAIGALAQGMGLSSALLVSVIFDILLAGLAITLMIQARKKVVVSQ